MSEPLRWSLNRIAEETGFARQTITNRMVQANVAPGADGCFSTRDMLAAVCGDYQAAKTRKIQAEAELAELALAKAGGELVAVSAVSQVWSAFLTDLRGAILSTNMPKADRLALVKLIRDIPIREYVEPAAAPEPEG